MAKTKLDPEEQDLLEAHESGGFESGLNGDRRGQVAQTAEETCRKCKRIT